jgi:hypothetical protein
MTLRTSSSDRHRWTFVGLIIGVVIVFAAAATAGAIALSSGGDPGLQSAAASPGVNPALATQLSVLSRPKTRADTLPTDFRLTAQHLDAYAGPDIAGARAVSASNGETAYLIPANAGVCVVNTNENFCADEASLAGADAVDLCSPTLPAGQMELEWLLPDGVSNVSIRRADGSAISFPATYNVYIARLPLAGSMPKTIAWDLDGQHHSMPTGIPDDAASEKCVHPNDVPPAANQPTITPGVYSLNSSGQIETKPTN